MMASKRIARAALVVAVAGLLACSPKASDPRTEKFAGLPDLRGVWTSEGLDAGISGFGDTGSKPPELTGITAPWNAATATRQRIRMTTQGGDAKAPGWGYPMMMDGPSPLEFIVTPEETLIVNFYRDIRHVYTDGRDHPSEQDLWPTVWGDSVGHWEGDTLVIDTISVKEPSKYFFIAPPLSARARYSERLRKTGPDRIESQMTIEDPETLTAPWVVKLAYVRAQGLDRLFHDDVFENDRSTMDGDTYTIAPPKEQP